MISCKHKKSKLMIAFLLIVCVLSMSIASAYMCINTQEDNSDMIEFKIKVNRLVYDYEKSQGMTDDYIKIKLFLIDPCNNR